MSSATFAYDVVEYPGHPQPQAHPARLCAIARLHGISTAAPSRCRFLEVGCGDGATLLPLALAYPESTFVGIDLSGVAIARGESMRRTLGLSNLTLLAADLTAWDPGPEPFDYVMAHGFYSWVPPAVRDALFALCRDRLAPTGLAYVSYNALPGCHIRRMIWDMLRFHVRAIAEPKAKIEQAAALLQFLAQGATGSGAYPDVLREEVKRVTDRNERSVMFHDDLADINDPVMVTQFVAHAARFGLRFLAEADYFEMTADLIPAPAAGVLRDLESRDVVLKEQYLDFLKARRFRQTLLCRAESSMRKDPDASAVMDFSVVGDMTAEPAPADLTPGVPVRFRTATGSAVTIDRAVVKAALVRLAEVFPLPVTVPALLAAARERVGPAAGTPDDDLKALVNVLTASYRVGLVDFAYGPPRFAVTAGPRPRVSALARAQVEAGAELLTSLRPSVVRMENPITREMLRLLDGSRDRTALLNDLADHAAGDPRFTAPGDPPRPADWWRERLGPQIEAGLASVARMALLVED